MIILSELAITVAIKTFLKRTYSSIVNKQYIILYVNRLTVTLGSAFNAFKRVLTLYISSGLSEEI
jgi:uncharacterized membrane protein